MTDALVHRGPTTHGEFISDAVGLGMRRLSIIDRGPRPAADGDRRRPAGAGLQRRDLQLPQPAPALEADGCAFRTDSDTEVVLRLLERDGPTASPPRGHVLLRAVGHRKRELTLARDWLGQKSLYWVETPEGFAFASEIKALLTLPGVARELDLDHPVPLHVAALPARGEDTFFQGIQKLPAAHEMTRHRRGRRRCANCGGRPTSRSTRSPSTRSSTASTSCSPRWSRST
jgi:asparagine synthase (glutamine-hydrolysing)